MKNGNRRAPKLLGAAIAISIEITKFASKPKRLQTTTSSFFNMKDRSVTDKIEYVVCCVGAFAARFGLSNAQAYAYLRRFSGIDFLIDCYAAEHTLSIDDAVSDLATICGRKGGRLA